MFFDGELLSVDVMQRAQTAEQFRRDEESQAGGDELIPMRSSRVETGDDKTHEAKHKQN